MGERILVVEDEATLCHNIARFLTRHGHRVTAVESGAHALAALRDSAFDVVITDLRLPDTDGLAVLDHARQADPHCVVVIMTAYASVDSAVEALRRGANDFVLKPLALSELLDRVERFASARRVERDPASLVAGTQVGGDAFALLRNGEAVAELCNMIERVASSSSNVLVTGESGAGKELVARAVHQRSARAGGPFVTLTVSAIPDGQIESCLFGDERGPDRRREGLLCVASGGTLFLDEIAELPLGTQAQLLRAIEGREVFPIGAERTVPVDTRLVAATHRDMGQLVASGRFRQDLLYRLQVVHLRVPPLREREGDIPALAQHFVELHARTQRKPAKDISETAMRVLLAYPWPGNVRELSHVIERAVVLSSGPSIERADLPEELCLASTPTDASAPSPTARSPGELPDEAYNLERVTLSFQRQHLVRALTRAGGNREAAARLLGLSNATFYRYLQKAGLKGYHVDV